MAGCACVISTVVSAADDEGSHVVKSAPSVRGLLESPRQSLELLRSLKEDAKRVGKRTYIGYSRSPNILL